MSAVQEVGGVVVEGRLSREEVDAALAARAGAGRLDVAATTAVDGIHAAASALRGYFERTALASHELTWTAWVVLWTMWIRGEQDAGHLATAAGISKGTLTGIGHTLERHELLRRRVHPHDRRRVLLSLTHSGTVLMEQHVEVFNAHEVAALAPLSAHEIAVLTSALRKLLVGLERGEHD